MTTGKGGRFGYRSGPPDEVNAELMHKASILTRYAPTPTGRLAQLGIEALDNGDLDMVRICLNRLNELGAKT